MRIPHYLVKSPSGVWHFCRRMLGCLVPVFKRPVIREPWAPVSWLLCVTSRSHFSVRLMRSRLTCGLVS